MATETQTGMDRAEMKRFLLKSKQEPVNCAIGVGDEKSLALLMLARNRSPKALQGELQKEFPTVFNTRFGTAMVDTDDDPTLVKFMLNKPVSSMARRLVKTLKGTGFRKVQILLEDGSPVEAAADEEASEQAGIGATGADSATGAPQAAPQPDPAALAAALAILVPRIAQIADPTQKEALAKQARVANVNIKTGNLNYAAAGIEQLRRALDAIAAPASSDSGAQQSAPSTPPPPPPPPPTSEAQPDPAALAAALAVLIPRVAQVTDPAQKEALAKQARLANVNIKTGNLAYAATGIEQLRRALDAIQPSGYTAAEEAVPPPPPLRSAPDASAPVASDTTQAAADPRIAQYQAAFARLMPALEKVVEIAPQRREGIDLQTQLFNAAMAAAEFDAAKEALMEIGLLAKPPADAVAENGADIEALNLAFRKSRLTWGQTRQKVHGQIRQFQAALRDELRDEPDFSELNFKVALLDRVLQRLDGSLETKLDEAMSADKRDTKLSLKQASRQQVMDYISFVNENPMIARLDSNRFMPLTVCADLTGQLAALAASLA